MLIKFEDNKKKITGLNLGLKDLTRAGQWSRTTMALFLWDADAWR